MRVLTKEEVIYLNKKNVSRFGGKYAPPYNFFHEHALDYLIEVVDSDMLGQPIYPEIHQKAGVYLFNIIADHVFNDGNKRTGLDAALLFLTYNGHRLSEGVSDEALIQFFLQIASGNLSLKEVQLWLKQSMEATKH